MLPPLHSRRKDEFQEINPFSASFAHTDRELESYALIRMERAGLFASFVSSPFSRMIPNRRITGFFFRVLMNKDDRPKDLRLRIYVQQ